MSDLAWMPLPLEPRFLLVLYCEDRDGIWRDAIASYVAAIAKVDDPLPELIGHFLNGPADSGLLFQHLHALADSLHGPFCSLQVLGGEEAIDVLHIKQRGL